MAWKLKHSRLALFKWTVAFARVPTNGTLLYG
jgi:hypothetical protein